MRSSNPIGRGKLVVVSGSVGGGCDGIHDWSAIVTESSGTISNTGIKKWPLRLNITHCESFLYDDEGGGVYTHTEKRPKDEWSEDYEMDEKNERIRRVTDIRGGDSPMRLKFFRGPKIESRDLLRSFVKENDGDISKIV